MLEIRFQGKKYVFTGKTLKRGGAIAKLEDYENGHCSFAHLFPNGDIQRFGNIIGKRKDIKIIGECRPNVGQNTLEGMLTDPSWRTNTNR